MSSGGAARLARPMSAAPRRSTDQNTNNSHHHVGEIARASAGGNMEKDSIQPVSVLEGGGGSMLGARGVQRRRPASAMARKTYEDKTSPYHDDIASVATTRPVSAQSRTSYIESLPRSTVASGVPLASAARRDRPASAMSYASSRSGIREEDMGLVADPYTERR